ncbi:MAG TPA: DedA family protein [Bdellovibrionales bacterium]|nr:DedA family protein [Bdellovibrionales bacterium]
MIIELGAQLINLFQHLPEHLQMWAVDYGVGLYAILALIVFCETGLVVTPFLPGDSLLFATGALLAHQIPGLDLGTMCVILILAAVLGDMVNYHVGKFVAPRMFKYENSRWLNRKHLDRTHAFYEKHGGKTIILARFMPIVRTYAPFVAGLSGMRYSSFFFYNVIGAIVWVVSFTCLGFFFGNLPTIKANFQYVILAIIALSVLPIGIEYLRARRQMPPAT